MSDILAGEGFEILSAGERTIATVASPITEEEEVAAEEELEGEEAAMEEEGDRQPGASESE